jgi:hypothetical protein
LEARLDLLQQVGAVGAHRRPLVLGDGEVALLAGGHREAVLQPLIAVEDGVDLLARLGLHALAEDVDRVVVLAHRRLTSHISATATVLAIASGTSPKTRSISALLFR